MYEKVQYSRDRLIEKIVDESNCDTLQERRELRAKIRGKSYDELIEKLSKLTAKPRPR